MANKLSAQVPAAQVSGSGTFTPPSPQATRLREVQKALQTLREQIAGLQEKRAALEEEAGKLLTHASLAKKLAKLTPAERTLLLGQ